MFGCETSTSVLTVCAARLVHFKTYSTIGFFDGKPNLENGSVVENQSFLGAIVF